MIKGVIFDMDGLMFDTEVLSRDGWVMAAETLGFDPVLTKNDFFLGTLGLTKSSIEKLYYHCFGQRDDFEKALEIRLNYMYDYVKKLGAPKKPGLTKLLLFLQESGIPAALATSSLKEKATLFLKSADVYEYFSGYICGDMVTHSKPHPEIFLTACEVLGLKPEECLVLEDSPNGLRASIAAGTHTIAIPDFLQVPEELSHQIDATCSSLLDVIEWIRKTNP